MTKQLIRFEPEQYARQIALLFMASPEYSEEEELLSDALAAACERMGISADDFVEKLCEEVAVETVEETAEETAPGTNAPGGTA